MKITLLGAGTIGFGVYELSEKDSRLDISKILDRRVIPEIADKLTDDIDSIMNDPEIETVVELLGGVEPARTWVLRAMAAGKNVVSANKLMISESLDELMAAAEKNGVEFRFSAAVGGGIPFLFNLLRARRADNILEVGGILNGTTNYMLDLMQTQGLEFGAVLKLAQDAGYAEQDPSADISGGDAKCKIMLASCIAYNGRVAKADVLCEGIEHVSKADMALISEKGYACRLIARAIRGENGISCCVEPTLVRKNSVPGNISLVENMAYFRGENAGPQRFTGAGAGRYATAYAVINDLLDIECGAGYNGFRISEAVLPVDNASELREYLVRGVSIPGAKELSDGYYITEKLPIKAMHAAAAKARAEGADVFFAGIDNDL